MAEQGHYQVEGLCCSLSSGEGLDAVGHAGKLGSIQGRVLCGCGRGLGLQGDSTRS